MKLQKVRMRTLSDLEEQIQEDILTYLEYLEDSVGFKMGFRYKAELCQGVTKRFNQYNKKED